ncbi:hypothetical protein V5799_023055 [Amblyomma americanum]|uniref:HSF-type DNA-binding domain-containing protein n=1 Tax=Amblyomma americanum TaxID=6943 RepID=A0AAQ4FJD4_AMBAM
MQRLDQLELDGFRKVTNTDQGLRSDREEIEFFHSFFIRGQECLLEFIKRKAITTPIDYSAGSSKQLSDCHAAKQHGKNTAKATSKVQSLLTFFSSN